MSRLSRFGRYENQNIWSARDSSAAAGPCFRSLETPQNERQISIAVANTHELAAKHFQGLGRFGTVSIIWAYAADVEPAEPAHAIMPHGIGSP